jgi:uncharacterized OB-fold protein
MSDAAGTTWTWERPDRLPLPQPEPDAEPFWDGLREGELRLQHCSVCGLVAHPPRAMCHECGSFEFEWEPVSGRGTVYTFAITQQPIHPALVDHTPFATVVIELEEGPRMTSNLIDVPPDEIEIGLAVEVVFDDVTDEVTLPLFRRASGVDGA